MLTVVDFLLLTAGLVCLALSTKNVASKVHLLALGLAFWILVPWLAALLHLIRVRGLN